MRFIRYGLAAVMIIAGALGLAGAAQADTKTFPKPKAGPYRVDWCLNWAAQCGQPAADRFCQNNGYATAIDFDQAPKLNLMMPPVMTVVQGSGQVCSPTTGAPQCDGFAQITCSKPDLPAQPPGPPPGPPPGGGGAGGDTQDFYKPKIGGVRLNYCQTKGAGCGQDAADAFCDMKGFDDAADYVQAPPAPPGVKTRYIGNGKFCKGPVCYAFQSITCENQP